MTFYLLIFILLFLNALFDFVQVSSSFRKFSFLISLFFLFFIVGFRFQTGVDWPAYESILNKTADLSEIFLPYGYQRIFSSLDFGFCLLNSIVKTIGGGIQVVFAIIAFTNYFFLYFGLSFFTKKYLNTSLLLYFLLFFFQYDMSGIRQGLAMSIFIFSLRYVVNRNIIKYIGCLFLAFSIHWTALILIPVYFLYNIPRRLSLSIFLFSFSVFMLKIKWFKSFVIAFTVNNYFLMNKINHYTTNKTVAVEKSMTIYTIFSILTIGSLFVFMYLLKHKEMPKVERNLIIALLTFQILTFFGMYELDAVASRFSNYFLVGNILSIIYIINYKRIVYHKLVYFIIFVIMLFIPNLPFILGFTSTVAYQPYQNFIAYKLFGGEDNGYNRVEEHRLTH
jgi:hypothetical protein